MFSAETPANVAAGPAPAAFRIVPTPLPTVKLLAAPVNVHAPPVGALPQPDASVR